MTISHLSFAKCKLDRPITLGKSDICHFMFSLKSLTDDNTLIYNNDIR